MVSQAKIITQTTMDDAVKILNNEVLQEKAPSVQYVFFDTERMIFEYSSGLSDLQNSIKVDRNTTYNIYSITKTFTALAILQLAEKGKLHLEDPVNRHLPNLNISPKVKLSHLLTHTSGLANPLPLNWIHLAKDHENFDRNAFFDPILEKHIRKELHPGKGFKYSNLGYVLLGQIIESVSAGSYEDYISENIIAKLDLQSDFLGFDVPHTILHATGYHKTRSLTGLLLGLLLNKKKFMEPGIGKWQAFKAVYVNGAAYGGLIGNTLALVKYGQELLKENSRLLSSQSRNLLFSEKILENGTNTGMSLSWFKGKTEAHKFYCHAGGGGGYYGELRLYPDQKRGSFVIFNRSGFKDEQFLSKVDPLFLKAEN